MIFCHSLNVTISHKEMGKMKLVSANAKDLWKERVELLHKRMTANSKEEWYKSAKESDEIEAELKRRGKI